MLEGVVDELARSDCTILAAVWIPTSLELKFCMGRPVPPYRRLNLAMDPAAKMDGSLVRKRASTTNRSSNTKLESLRHSKRWRPTDGGAHPTIRSAAISRKDEEVGGGGGDRGELGLLLVLLLLLVVVLVVVGLVRRRRMYRDKGKGRGKRGGMGGGKGGGKGGGERRRKGRGKRKGLGRWEERHRRGDGKGDDGGEAWNL
mmetsp:Transcript_15315/g.27253  ORF Transcript_15315/g.27253 Transcript_15315/m.27253 type:complete len:201 (+) Transcript_15315:554-1156(+)